jgi:hypothetical protein
MEFVSQFSLDPEKISMTIKNEDGAVGMDQAIQSLPCKHEARSSNPSSTKIKNEVRLVLISLPSLLSQIANWGQREICQMSFK